MTLEPIQYLLGALSGSLVGFTLGLVGGGGSILAVPLTLAVKAFLVDADPRMRWFSTFLTTPDAELKRGRRRAAQMAASEPKAEAAQPLGATVAGSAVSPDSDRDDQPEG